MASGNGDLWVAVSNEVSSLRTEVRGLRQGASRVEQGVGRLAKALSRVAADSRKRFDAQQAQIRALDERLRAVERQHAS